MPSTRWRLSPTRPRTSLGTAVPTRISPLIGQPLGVGAKRHGSRNGSARHPRPVGCSSPGRQPYGVEDLRVARAAADVARERLADLVLRRLLVLGEERNSRDDEAGRAEA